MVEYKGKAEVSMRSGEEVASKSGETVENLVLVVEDRGEEKSC